MQNKLRIDLSDLHLLKKFKYHQSGKKGNQYLARHIGRRVFKLHRDIIKAKQGESVDHINGDRLDNRKSNLRIVDKQRNEANTGPRRNNSTGFKGIRFHTSTGKYTAQMNAGKTQIYLSIEKTPEDAAMVYNWAAYEWYGSYAKFNTVPQPWLECEC